MTQQPTNTVVMAFTEDQVERLTGISKSKLRYWDRTDFFKPEFADENRRVAFSRVYSFKDVASLRVLGVLQRQYNVPLQNLRKVSARLAEMNIDGWAGIVLYVLNRRVNFYDPETDNIQDVANGQYALGIPLEVVIGDTRRDVEALRNRGEEDFGQIERHRRFAGNAWCVAGTRIPIKAIRGFHEAGYSVRAIIDQYPELTEEDVRAALQHDGGQQAA